MRSHQRYAECVNLLEKCLEAFVLCDPCLDIHDQVFGNMNRTGFATVLIRQTLGVMERSAALAATGRATAAHGNDAAGGSQDGGATGQLLKTAAQHVADDGGVIRNAHRDLRKRGRRRRYGSL
jgi:hypothetical protein